MDETEHMPRYTLTLVDSTGAMEPLILMDDDLKSIAAKLEGRVSAKTRGRLPRGTGGISATPKGYRAYSTVTDPLTGKDHRVSGFGRTRSQAEARLKEKLAEFDRTHRVGYVRWIGNGVLDRFLEDESLFGEFLRAPVSEGGVEPLVVEPPHVVVEVGA